MNKLYIWSGEATKNHVFVHDLLLQRKRKLIEAFLVVFLYWQSSKAFWNIKPVYKKNTESSFADFTICPQIVQKSFKITGFQKHLVITEYLHIFNPGLQILILE